MKKAAISAMSKKTKKTIETGARFRLDGFLPE
jgi:hypothetical protein